MPVIQKILIPVDFSDSAQHAFDYGVALAREHAAAVVILHTYMTPALVTPEGAVVSTATDLDEGIARMASALERLQVQAREQGVRQVEILLRDAVAWRGIVEVARERACDMIVMGSHGHSGVTHLLLGSVAGKVVRKAHCPVTVVKSPAAVTLATTIEPVDEVC